MKRTLIAFAALLAAPLAAHAQYVKDFVEVDGARANKLRGYGIVTGLNGNGDSPKGESARVLRNMLQNMVPADNAVVEINARNAALVMVLAELAPFQKKGTRLDVSVSAVGDARSLAGGELQLTDLRGPLGRQDPNIYALASGRLVMQGDAKRGNPTAALVPGGAITEKELVHAFVQERAEAAGARRYFRLLLRKPDLTLAGQLTQQVNAQAVAGGGRRMKVATALDGGSLEIAIPTIEEYKQITGNPPETDFVREPVRWLEAVLNLPVTLSSVETAAVVINDATKTVSWTGEVRLREGSVMVPPAGPGSRPGVFHAREGQKLSEFMEKVGPALGDQQIVDVVRSLHHAGLIKAEVKSQ